MKKKDMKKLNNFRYAALILVVFGTMLILFGVLTPANKKYYNEDTTFTFTSKEVKTETNFLSIDVSKSYPWSIKTEDGEKEIMIQLNENIKSSLGIFKGTEIVSGDVVYKSDEALALIIVGAVVAFLGLASEGYVCYKKYIK